MLYNSTRLPGVEGSGRWGCLVKDERKLPPSEAGTSGAGACLLRFAIIGNMDPTRVQPCT